MYVMNDDDGSVGSFTSAQERAFTKTIADNSWGETIWGSDMTSAYTSGYPGTVAAYSDLEDMGSASILKAGILDAIGDFERATEVIEIAWSNYKEGFAGLSYSDEVSSSTSNHKIIWSNSDKNMGNWCGW